MIEKAVEEEIIQYALHCLEHRIKFNPEKLSNPQDVSAYFRLKLAMEQNEVFSVLFLDNAHRLIAFEKLFYGTINKCVVHSRVVVQKALAYNAAAVIFAHNHPSGNIEPSSADIKMTQEVKTILEIIDVRVLDHFIVSSGNYYSFAEHDLL